MKHKLLLTLFCLSLLTWKAVAQTPITSTAENPLWYIIQVESSGSAAKFVATQFGDSVVGRALAISDPQAINMQLWRFEPATKANRFNIISKSTGKKMAPIEDTALGTIIGLTDATPASAWRFLNIGNGIYKIEIDPVPEGTPAENKNLFQASSSYKYVWMLSSATAEENVNARFVYKTVDLPIVSNNENQVWLYIESAKTGNAGKFLTETTDASFAESFSLEPKSATDSIAQQWKLVRNTKNPARVDFVNRKTGSVVSTNSQFKKMYFYTQSAVNTTGSDGWILTELKNSQYQVGTTNAGYVQYWNATTEGDPSVTYVAEGDKTNTAYAWIFRMAEMGGTTGSQEVTVDNVRVYSTNRRIYVTGSEEYAVYNIYGQRQPNNRELPVGIYLVRTNGKTTKIIVK